MGKYEVKFSCGHTETIELFGPYKDRERRIEYLEQYGVCSDCYNAKQDSENSVGCEKVLMKYSEYKKNYSECKTKKDSYDSENKTIIVFVPKKTEERLIKEKAEKEALDALCELQGICIDNVRYNKYLVACKMTLERPFEEVKEQYSQLANSTVDNEKQKGLYFKVIEIVEAYKKKIGEIN